MPAVRKRKAEGGGGGGAATKRAKPSGKKPQLRVVVTGWEGERLLPVLCGARGNDKRSVHVVSNGGGTQRVAEVQALADEHDHVGYTRVARCACCVNRGGVHKAVNGGCSESDAVVVLPSPMVDVTGFIDWNKAVEKAVFVAAVPARALLEGLWCSATVAEWVADRTQWCDEEDEDDVRGVHEILHQHIQHAHVICVLDEDRVPEAARGGLRRLVAQLNPHAPVLAGAAACADIWTWLADRRVPDTPAFEGAPPFDALFMRAPELVYATGVMRMVRAYGEAASAAGTRRGGVVHLDDGGFAYVDTRPFLTVKAHAAMTALQSALVGGGLIAHARGTMWVSEDPVYSYDVTCSGGRWGVAKGAPWGDLNPTRQEFFIMAWEEAACGTAAGTAEKIAAHLSALGEGGAGMPAAAADEEEDSDDEYFSGRAGREVPMKKRKSAPTAAEILEEWDAGSDDDSDAAVLNTERAGGDDASASSFYEEHTLQLDLPEGTGELFIEPEAIAELRGIARATAGGRTKKHAAPGAAVRVDDTRVSPAEALHVQYPVIVRNPGCEPRSLNAWWTIAQRDKGVKTLGSRAWYLNGRAYWGSLLADLRGVELDELHWYDAVHSRGCFERWNLRGEHAVDLGGGLGRFASAVLVDYYDTIDLVESTAHLVAAARDVLSEERLRLCHRRGRLGTAYTLPLQHFDPNTLFPRDDRPAYALASLTWVLMFLTDADVLLLLFRLKTVLAPGARLFVKENTLETEFAVNCENSSTNRSLQHYHLLFESAGYRVEATDRMVHVPGENNLHNMTAFLLSVRE